MNRSHRPEGIPNAGAGIANTLLNAVVKQFPASQEKQGDENLNQTCALTNEFEPVISDNDRRVIEERITFARKIKVGLGSKSCISKFLRARKYRRASSEAYRYAKVASDRGRDTAKFGSEDIYVRVIKTARSLYRCSLGCKDAFPSPHMKEKLAKIVWNEACTREGAHPHLLLRQDKEFVYSSMRLLADIKMKIKHAVESSYEFDTSRAPDSISRNSSRAQALLSEKKTFVYREPDISPLHKYRHPIIQTVINVTWFQSNDDDGIVFREYFTPISVELIGLALTVIECCIDEWSDGTWKESNWSEERYKMVYLSHLGSLRDFRNLGHHQQGKGLLSRIQDDLLSGARIHASTLVIADSGRLPIDDQIPAIRVSCE